MTYEADAGQRRWLLKAIREASGELFGQFSGLGEEGLRWRPAKGEWCLKEVAAHLRDAEVLARSQIELITQGGDPLLPDEALDTLPSERNYREQRLSRLLNEYEVAREETVWMLRMLDEEDWERCGRHPYKGLVSVYDLVRAIHEHDLEHLWQARRIREAYRQK